MIRVALIIVLVFSALAQAQGQGQDKHIVKFRPGTSQAERAAAVQRAGGKLKFNYSIVDAVAITGSNPNVLAALQREPSVENIVPDLEIHGIQDHKGIGISRKPAPVAEVTTSSQVTPHGVQRVGAPTNETSGPSNGDGIGVAIVDTGIDLANLDLAPSSQTFSAFGTSCQDDNGHGTHVSGIVGALDNGIGVIGVAPKAKLYCVKVLNAEGSGSDSDVMAGLNWVAAANAAGAQPPIRVVNMSLGRDGSVDDNPSLRDAVKNLNSLGIIVVVAAGNDATKEVKNMVPASYRDVFAVAATTAMDGTNACRRFSGVIKADTASYFTTDGKYELDTARGFVMGVTISGPGEDQENISKGCFISSVGILSTKLGGGTVRMAGTSMASPHVAGVVARIMQKGTLGRDAIRAALRSDTTQTVPWNSPTSGYTFDGEREGIAKAP